MEWLNFFQGKGIWIVTGGVLAVLLVQIITLHKIKKTADLLKGIEAGLKKQSETIEKQKSAERNIQQIERETVEITELPEKDKERQGQKESQEQLIDAVLAEVFR